MSQRAPRTYDPAVIMNQLFMVGATNFKYASSIVLERKVVNCHIKKCMKFCRFLPKLEHPLDLKIVCLDVFPAKIYGHSESDFIRICSDLPRIQELLTKDKSDSSVRHITQTRIE